MAQETLFPAPAEPSQKDQPLAARMRPRSLDEFVGQEHLVGPEHELRRAIEEDRVGSMILWGPPGSGKTTLARLIARVTSSHFVPLSAVSAGVADLRRNIEEARLRRAQSGQRTILFIDEIHRFNKGQQDAVLPYVEEGVITLIGATTENPSFEVNAALLSRTRVFVLAALDDVQVGAIVDRAISDPDRGLGHRHVDLEGDARAALTQAVAAQQAAHFIGMPEANLALAQAVVYLATAPKSNALYAAYATVQEDVERTRADPVPLHLRNAPTPLMRKIGYGKGYRYAHDYEDAQVEQQHLPDAIKDRTYYHPSERGYEKSVKERLDAFAAARLRKPS